MVKIRNKDRLYAKLRRLAPAAKEELRKVAEKSGAEMVTTAQRFAPIDTGALRDSIQVTPGGQSTPGYSQPGGSSVVPEGSAMVTVGNSKVRYPHLVEYGTTRAPAQPYFWPAYRILRTRIRGRFSRALNKSVKQVAGRV